MKIKLKSVRTAHVCMQLCTAAVHSSDNLLFQILETVEEIQDYRLKLIVGRSLAERTRIRKLVDERVKTIVKQVKVWCSLLLHRFAAVLKQLKTCCLLLCCSVLFDS